jgi:hypothetical protein
MKTLYKVVFLVPFLFYYVNMKGQNYSIPLYNGAIPNSKDNGGKEKIDRQDITVISNVQVPGIDVNINIATPEPFILI